MKTVSRLSIKDLLSEVPDAREGFEFYGIPVAEDDTFDVREAVIVLGNCGVGKVVQRLSIKEDN